jgi:ADP-ribosylglycohydrolase
LGGAVGDALGAPVEFMRRSEIIRRFGPNGVTAYAPAYGGFGRITDDTQMTLFTAEGLLRAWVRHCLKGITTYSGVTAHAYLRWLQTQGERPSCEMGSGNDETGWLFKQKGLHHRRAPGTTCLSALKAMKSFGDPARNESKGCGGVMRVAPVGLFAWRLSISPEDTFSLGVELAALTHGHPTGALTAGVFAVLVLALTDGATMLDAMTSAKRILTGHPAHEETLRAIQQAEVLAASELPRVEALAQIGEGWVAEEALAMSVYCTLVARDFRDGVILAVNHDGDSDSTGSITGNLLGAMHGSKAVPQEWLAQLELRDVITELAEDLYAFPDWKIDMNEQKIWEKYPGF